MTSFFKSLTIHRNRVPISKLKSSVEILLISSHPVCYGNVDPENDKPKAMRSHLLLLSWSNPVNFYHRYCRAQYCSTTEYIRLVSAQAWSTWKGCWAKECVVQTECFDNWWKQPRMLSLEQTQIILNDTDKKQLMEITKYAEFRTNSDYPKRYWYKANEDSPLSQNCAHSVLLKTETSSVITRMVLANAKRLLLSLQTVSSKHSCKGLM